MTKPVLLACLFMCIAVSVVATAFKTPAARNAERDYRKAVKSAREQYVSSLEKAMQEAARSKDTAEVKKIVAELERVRTINDSDAPESTRLAVDADQLSGCQMRFCTPAAL